MTLNLDPPKVADTNRSAADESLSLGSMFRGPAWPLGALLVLYPLWWVLGVTPFVWIILAVPMLRTLARRRPLVWPPWFALWLAFLGVVALGALVIGVEAPNTLGDGDVTSKYLVFGLRFLHYVSITVLLVFVGNMTERELPRLRLIRMMGVLFITTVLGGLLGMIAPGLDFSSPTEAMLTSDVVDSIIPGASLQGNALVAQLTHVSVAQSQDILGSPRPSAPFEFSNAWGNNYAILLGWFILAFLFMGRTRARWFAAALLLVSTIPAVYSQNRGMWLGLGIAVVYVLVRLILLGRYRAVLAAILGTTVVVATLFLVPPFNSVIADRIQTPNSNEIRASLARQAWSASLHSPIVGYGTTRSTIGSERSAAIGATLDCPKCGNRVIGSTGQMWLMLISHGVIGASLYYVFFAQAVVRYWRDRTWIGLVGVLSLILTLFFGLFYTALVSPLAVAMLSLGLLWRNARDSDADSAVA